MTNIDKNSAKAAAQQKQAESIKAAIRAAGYVAIDQNGVARFITHLGNQLVALRLESQKAKDIIQADVAVATGKSVSKQTLEREIEVMRGHAHINKKTCTVYVRVAGRNGIYQLDLSNDTGEIVEISAGKWNVIKNTSINFAPVSCSIPTPIKPSSLIQGYRMLCAFYSWLGIPKPLHLIFTIVLVEYLRPETAYPILDLIGASGSGKTSAGRAVITLIDPASGKIPETNIDDEDIAAIAQSRHILSTDNNTSFSGEKQDLLCKVAYGCTLTPRKFYTQTEVEQLPVHNPVIVTSINPAITRSDLLARTIRVPFAQRKGGYISEEDVTQYIETKHPYVLGALLECLSAGLKNLPQVKQARVWTQRLVDFAQMGEAISQALGNAPDAFVKSLEALRENTAHDIVEGDPLAEALIKVIRDKMASAQVGKLPHYRNWAPSPGWSAVEEVGRGKCLAIKPKVLLDAIHHTRVIIDPQWLPKSPRALSSAINLKLPLLADLGINGAIKNLGGKGHSAWVFTLK